MERSFTWVTELEFLFYTATNKLDVYKRQCLNAGCIPAKCLLHTAELVSQMNEQGADIGMKVSGVEVPPGAVSYTHLGTVCRLRQRSRL